MCPVPRFKGGNHRYQRTENNKREGLNNSSSEQNRAGMPVADGDEGFGE